MGKRPDVETILNGLKERLAAIEHERWSHWQRYMHSKAQKQPDGSLVIPAELAERWEIQANTDFFDLTDAEKDSDREQVDRYLRTIIEGLKSYD